MVYFFGKTSDFQLFPVENLYKIIYHVVRSSSKTSYITTIALTSVHGDSF